MKRRLILIAFGILLSMELSLAVAGDSTKVLAVNTSANIKNPGGTLTLASGTTAVNLSKPGTFTTVDPTKIRCPANYIPIATVATSGTPYTQAGEFRAIDVACSTNVDPVTYQISCNRAVTWGNQLQSVYLAWTIYCAP